MTNKKNKEIKRFKNIPKFLRLIFPLAAQFYMQGKFAGGGVIVFGGGNFLGRILYWGRR